MTSHDHDDDRDMRALFAPLRDEPARLPPGFRTALLARLHRERPSRLGRAWSWMARPHTVRVRPAVALALAAAAVVAVLARPTAPSPAPVVEREAALMVPVQLVFSAPAAASVAVTGDFLDWDPAGVPMRPVGAGGWVAELTLAPGVHHYVFVVDRADWRPDPLAVAQVDDGFGQQNSVLLVAGPRS